MMETYTCETPEDTFELGERIGGRLNAGDLVMLNGGLGAGKTLLTKGILNALGFDVDEVTSPSFTLVNLYDTQEFDIYHIDLWRLEPGNDVVAAVGLAEILDNERAITIIEWPERLQNFSYPRRVISVKIEGDGDDTREITIDES